MSQSQTGGQERTLEMVPVFKLSKPAPPPPVQCLPGHTSWAATNSATNCGPSFQMPETVEDIYTNQHATPLNTSQEDCEKREQSSLFINNIKAFYIRKIQNRSKVFGHWKYILKTIWDSHLIFQKRRRKMKSLHTELSRWAFVLSWPFSLRQTQNTESADMLTLTRTCGW